MIRRLAVTVRDQLLRLRVADGAAAAVEFALILPIMLTLYIGSVEGGTLITVDRKVQAVAGALGDLVARSNETIRTADLTDYFQAAGGILTPYSATPLVQMVTQVEVRTDGTTRVDWCRQYVNGVMSVCTRYRVNTAFTPPLRPGEGQGVANYNPLTAIVDVSKGGYIIVSEANYAYTPMSTFVLTQPITLYRQNFFLPRFDGRIALN